MREQTVQRAMADQGTLGLLASGQICNTSPGLAGAVGSSYEDYSVTKDTEEKLTEAQWKG